MKVGKKEKEERILLYSWLPTGTYHNKSGNFGFLFLPEIWRIWGHFFGMENPFV
jgi:hypothetical protein